MPERVYPFVDFKNDQGRIIRPASSFLPVRITNPHVGRSIKTFALIDTGADECAFPATVARLLAHDLRGQGVMTQETMGVSGACSVFKHTFDLEILSPDHKTVVARYGNILVSCVVARIPPLLGVRDCLRNFCLTIDYPRRRTRLRW